MSSTACRTEGRLSPKPRPNSTFDDSDELLSECPFQVRSHTTLAVALDVWSDVAATLDDVATAVFGEFNARKSFSFTVHFLHSCINDIFVQWFNSLQKTNCRIFGAFLNKLRVLFIVAWRAHTTGLTRLRRSINCIGLCSTHTPLQSCVAQKCHTSIRL